MVSARTILPKFVPDFEWLQDLASCPKWGLVQTQMSRTHLDGQRLPKILWDFCGSPNWMIHCAHLLFKNALFRLGSRNQAQKVQWVVQSCRDGTAFLLWTEAWQDMCANRQDGRSKRSPHIWRCSSERLWLPQPCGMIRTVSLLTISHNTDLSTLMDLTLFN